MFLFIRRYRDESEHQSLSHPSFSCGGLGFDSHYLGESVYCVGGSELEDGLDLSGNTLRALTTLQPPDGPGKAIEVVDTALANAMYATQATVHGVFRTTPRSISCSRNMVLDNNLTKEIGVQMQCNLPVEESCRAGILVGNQNRAKCV